MPAGSTFGRVRVRANRPFTKRRSFPSTSPTTIRGTFLRQATPEEATRGWFWASARELEHIKLDKRTGVPGSIAWDGTRVAVGTGGFVLKGAPRIYRVKISGTSGRVTGETVPRDPAMYARPIFSLFAESVVSIAGSAGDRVNVWPYPSGGTRTQYIGFFERIEGMTISAGHAP